MVGRHFIWYGWLITIPVREHRKVTSSLGLMKGQSHVQKVLFLLVESGVFFLILQVSYGVSKLFSCTCQQCYCPLTYVLGSNLVACLVVCSKPRFSQLLCICHFFCLLYWVCGKSSTQPMLCISILLTCQILLGNVYVTHSYHCQQRALDRKYVWLQLSTCKQFEWWRPCQHCQQHWTSTSHYRTYCLCQPTRREHCR